MDRVAEGLCEGSKGSCAKYFVLEGTEEVCAAQGWGALGGKCVAAYFYISS
jgi:hypothetical protein